MKRSSTEIQAELDILQAEVKALRQEERDLKARLAEVDKRLTALNGPWGSEGIVRSLTHELDQAQNYEKDMNPETLRVRARWGSSEREWAEYVVESLGPKIVTLRRVGARHGDNWHRDGPKRRIIEVHPDDVPKLDYVPKPKRPASKKAQKEDE